jgi:TetR/AcrR family transcriptional regulator, cholesterol catabolism regulator
MVALETKQMPKGIPLTEDELEQRRNQILEATAGLFLEKGFYETPMHEVAKAAGIGKSTLYDYFSSKDEIIVYAIENSLKEVTQRARAIIGQDTDAKSRLRHLMHMHLNHLLNNRAFFLRLTVEAGRLNRESQDRIQVKRHAYQDMLQDLIEEGITEGSFRPVNAAVAMKTLISMMTPVVFTTRPAGTPAEMLNDALDLFFNGIES